VEKPKKSSTELKSIIASRLSELIGKTHLPPLHLVHQSTDKAGRTWAVLDAAPTPEIRAVVDAVRDEYDLAG
jgi:hypothetical protein